MTLAFLVSLVASTFFQIALPIFYLYNPEMGMPLSINGKEILDRNMYAWIYLMIHFISSLIFIYGIIKVYQVVNELSFVRIFGDNVSKGLQQAGKAFIVSAIIYNVLIFIVNNNTENSIISNFGATYNSLFFPLIIGLLLYVLGVVIKIAKSYKEESDLTV